MKKIILMILMMIGFVLTTSASGMEYYRSTSFAMAQVYNGQYHWSQFEQSNVNIVMDSNKNIITIYSSTIQVYRIMTVKQQYTDNEGGSQIAYTVYDQDGDRGTLRLRVINSTMQLYVDFTNVAWCYNIVPVEN